MSDSLLHDLAKELPEYKEKIHTLKTSDNHFAKLFEEYEELDKQIYRVEQQIESASDEFAEALKKKRLQLKDELFQLLKAA